MPISPVSRQKINRFNVTDLSRAIAANPTDRASQLRTYLGTQPRRSYRPTRDFSPLIYGTNPPLATIPHLPWEAIEAQIQKCKPARIVPDNIEAARALFDLVRPLGYVAEDHEAKHLTVGPGRVVPIDIRVSVVDGERLAFQFLHLRKERLSDDAHRVLASFVHQIYAVGDFDIAEVDIVDLSAPPRSKRREPRICQISHADMLGADELRLRTQEVYVVLEEIAEDMGEP